MAKTEGPRRHETRALLRAHLAAASGHRHATRYCPVCARLLRLALEAGPEPDGVPPLTSASTEAERAAAAN